MKANGTLTIIVWKRKEKIMSLEAVIDELIEPLGQTFCPKCSNETLIRTFIKFENGKVVEQYHLCGHFKVKERKETNRQKGVEK